MACLARVAKQSDPLRLHKAGDGAQRRRLIRLSSAGWVPPSVSSSRGCPRS